MRIDSHQHFWQLSRGDYSWLTPELELLYKDFLPDELAPILGKYQVNKTILVQAATTTAETEFMLQVATETEFVAGVVGWVDMESINAIAQLDHFSQNPYFKGIRPMIQEIEDVNWMLKPSLAPVFDFLIAKELTFDALVLPQHLDALYILLKRHPALKVVIDHGAKPSILNNSSPEWFDKIASIASETSAFCKLSGLVTEAGVNPNFEQLAPYMEHLLVCFGSERLMWGSDWPVVETSSNYQSFTKPLLKQRLITDQAIAKFLVLIKNEIDPSVQKSIRFYSDQVRSNFKELAVHREHLDNKSVSFLQTYHAYSSLIEQLLSISENLTHVDMNSQLANNISAISSILVFKEYMGQIRAIGMNMVSGNNNDIYSNLDISLLVGKQINALRVFNYSANNQQKKLCSNFCDEKEHVQMLKQEFSHIMNKHNADQRGEYWFELMSGKIDKLKGLTDSLTINFKNTVSAESQKLRMIYLTTLLVLSVFLFGAILLSTVLNFSIINPIRRITDALNSMAEGHRNIHFGNIVNHDEIGAIQLAYEKLRRRLLQIDIFQVVVDSQKNEIEYRKSQQEHFEVLAFTDALTGAVNRHQFNIVLGEEISRAKYEQKSLSILLLDIDYFKKINDSFGHGVGDEVLILFYKACKNEARSDDVVARIGGEEFVIILPKTNAQSAYQFAERLREKIQQLGIIIDDNAINFTVSIGVSEWLKGSFSCAEDFIADADKSLYQAKDQGRNRVVG